MLTSDMPKYLIVHPYMQAGGASPFVILFRNLAERQPLRAGKARESLEVITDTVRLFYQSMIFSRLRYGPARRG
jgi:hypothetical protein